MAVPDVCVAEIGPCYHSVENAFYFVDSAAILDHVFEAVHVNFRGFVIAVKVLFVALVKAAGAFLEGDD